MINTHESWPFDEVGLSYDRSEVSLPELYAGFEIHLQPVEDDDPANQSASGITAYELGIWLRHASSKVVQIGGQSTCRLSTPPKIQVGSPLAETGVHEPCSCVEDKTGCAIHDAFGPNVKVNGQLKSQDTHTSMELSPWSDSTNSTVRDASPSGEETPSQTVTVLWRLTFEEDLSLLGLFAEGVNYLDIHASEYQVQHGESKKIHVTVRRATLLNPLYTPLERLRTLETHTSTSEMDRKDDEWSRILRPASVEALQERLSGPDGLNPAIHSGDNEGDDSVDDPVDEDHHEGRRRGNWTMSYWG